MTESREQVNEITVYKQLQDYCNCINVSNSDIDELIHLVSNYTCWAQSACETFLRLPRKQVVTLPDCICDCDVYEFVPFYTPYDTESFKFTMVAQTGIEETSTSIEDFVYSETDQSFKMQLPLPSCKCATNCGCKTKYKLIVEYVAGYELIPDCLLPVFCEMLQYVKEKNTCDCSECQTCGDQYDTGKQEVFTYTLTDQLKLHLVQMLTEQYKRQLSQISLCDRQNELWGFVV